MSLLRILICVAPLLGCGAVAENVVDGALGTTAEQKFYRNQDRQIAESRKPPNENRNPPTSTCVSGVVQSTGPLGAPLANALVRVFEKNELSYETSTPSDGTFRVCWLPGREVEVRVSASGYQPKTAAIDLHTPPEKLDIFLVK